MEKRNHQGEEQAVKIVESKKFWLLTLGSFLGVLFFFILSWSGGMGYIYEYLLPDKSRFITLKSGACYELRNGWAFFDARDKKHEFLWGLILEPHGNDFLNLINPTYLDAIRDKLKKKSSNEKFTVWQEMNVGHFFVEDHSLGLVFSHTDKELLMRFIGGNIKTATKC